MFIGRPPTQEDIAIEMARVERVCFTRAIERINARNAGELFHDRATEARSSEPADDPQAQVLPAVLL
jgi:hypothetical protein